MIGNVLMLDSESRFCWGFAAMLQPIMCVLMGDVLCFLCAALYCLRACCQQWCMHLLIFRGPWCLPATPGHTPFWQHA